MRFHQQGLSFAEQAEQLIERGLAAERGQLEQTLSVVNYYRLSAYWHTFLKDGSKEFEANASFSWIWKTYLFDRQLRLLVMDALERVEVALLRTRLVEHHARKYGPYGYRDPRNFSPKLKTETHDRLLKEIDQATRRSKEEFVEGFFEEFDEERSLPLWMAAEVTTFGTLFTLFRNLHRKELISLARQIKLDGKVLGSWLHSFNYVRNLCAHHGRLWNREMAIKPLVPKSAVFDSWKEEPLSNARVFYLLCILRWLLQEIAPQSNWPQRLEKLIEANDRIPLGPMGMPEKWKQHPAWSGER